MDSLLRFAGHISIFWHIHIFWAIKNMDSQRGERHWGLWAMSWTWAHSHCHVLSHGARAKYTEEHLQNLGWHFCQGQLKQPPWEHTSLKCKKLNFHLFSYGSICKYRKLEKVVMGNNRTLCNNDVIICNINARMEA